jgi:hypothetical protein
MDQPQRPTIERRTRPAISGSAGRSGRPYGRQTLWTRQSVIHLAATTISKVSTRPAGEGDGAAGHRDPRAAGCGPGAPAARARAGAAARLARAGAARLAADGRQGDVGRVAAQRGQGSPGRVGRIGRAARKGTRTIVDIRLCPHFRCPSDRLVPPAVAAGFGMGVGHRRGRLAASIRWGPGPCAA